MKLNSSFVCTLNQNNELMKISIQKITKSGQKIALLEFLVIEEYDSKFKKKRRKQLNELAAEAQELNLGY